MTTLLIVAAVVVLALVVGALYAGFAILSGPDEPATLEGGRSHMRGPRKD